MSSTPKKVAILGAGVSGLASAKTLKQYGLDVTVFEAKAELGGVWANNYKSLCVLEPSCVYGYPDWPWPSQVPLFPPASDVRHYLGEYARHFDVFDHIRFNARIVRASVGEDSRWIIEWQSNSQTESAEFDFFVMAPGMFNIPKIPEWPGMEEFDGEIIHSSQLRDTEQIADKNVAIVGFSRSAMDIAVDIVDDAKSVTILHRSVRWPVPEKVLGLIRNHILLFARWPTVFAPPWIRPGRFAALLHRKLGFLVNGFWKLFELLLEAQFGLKSLKLMPDRPIKQDLFTNLYITPRRFFTLVADGLIRSVRSNIERFDADGVKTTDAGRISAEVVICATGWRHDYSFLPQDLLEKIYDQDGVHLYRHMVHPDIPGFAFVGGVQGINSATLFAIQATWVAQYLTRRTVLPSRQTQLDEIEALGTWNRSFVTERPNRSQILNLHQLPYIDDLMKDMNLDPRRKLFLLDQVVPYRSADYREVVASAQPR